MPRLIAFLRAINVGGHVVSMAELRRIVGNAGFTGVETFIASGNVIFDSHATNIQALERRIERGLATALGYEVKTFIRTEAEVAAIACYSPFPASRVRSAGAFTVGFLARPLAPPAVKALMALRTPIDDFRVHGREVYWLCRKKQSESTFSNSLLEKTLKTNATFRGLRTVSRLVAKYAFKST